MALPMSRPTKHRRTGVYQFRMRVPADLVAQVGREEVTRSLSTKDPVQAKRRFAEVRAEFEALWAN